MAIITETEPYNSSPILDVVQYKNYHIISQEHQTLNRPVVVSAYDPRYTKHNELL